MKTSLNALKRLAGRSVKGGFSTGSGEMTMAGSIAEVAADAGLTRPVVQQAIISRISMAEGALAQGARVSLRGLNPLGWEALKHFLNCRGFYPGPIRRHHCH